MLPTRTQQVRAAELSECITRDNLGIPGPENHGLIGDSQRLCRTSRTNASHVPELWPHILDFRRVRSIVHSEILDLLSRDFCRQKPLTQSFQFFLFNAS